IGDGREVPAVRHRIEAHGIEIGQHDLVPGSGQRLCRGAGQRAVEALRLGMGVHDEDAHEGSRSIREATLPESASPRQSARARLLWHREETADIVAWHLHDRSASFETRDADPAMQGLTVQPEIPNLRRMTLRYKTLEFLEFCSPQVREMYQHWATLRGERV